MDPLLQELWKETEEESAILQGDQEVNKQIYTDMTSNFVIQSEKFLKDELIMIRKHPRYIDFPSHSHDYIEMNYVFHGKFHQQIAGEDITLKKGDILLLNQHIEHQLFACREKDIIINFIIHPAFFDYILSNLSIGFSQSQMLHFLINSMFNYTPQGQYLYYPVSDSERIQDIMKQLLVEMMNNSILSKSKIKFLMGLLIVELVERQSKSHTNTHQNDHHRFLTEMFSYIEEHYKDANLDTLASMCNQTPYWVSKQIKTLTKQNFKDLVKEKRLMVAKNLLIHSNLSMQAIAEEVGYENISYFYRIFKNKYGQTPKVYKNNLLEEN